MPSNVHSSRKVRNEIKCVTMNQFLKLFNVFRYFCRSIEFDDMTKQCVISEEDSVSQKDDLGISSSPTNNFYDLVCLDNRKS